jgi:predicted  nucleic acid-binding Zn-ribbon protein
LLDSFRAKSRDQELQVGRTTTERFRKRCWVESEWWQEAEMAIEQERDALRGELAEARDRLAESQAESKRLRSEGRTLEGYLEEALGVAEAARKEVCRCAMFS